MYAVENLQIPTELLENFNKQAEKAVNLLIEKSDNENSIRVYMQKAYTQALIDNFVKNNGIPSIPFPISLSTVDMICILEGNDDIKIMFGRKPGQPKWQFPGGFRDPKETSRFAASRELCEEANLTIDSKRLEHIGELFVDDIRYRNTPHKITTQIYLCRLTEEEANLASPGDDLGEIEFKSLKDLSNDMSCIREIHIPIFEILKNHFDGKII